MTGEEFLAKVFSEFTDKEIEEALLSNDCDDVEQMISLYMLNDGIVDHRQLAEDMSWLDFE